MEIAESFLAQFYALEGITLAQRKKNLFMLLQKNAALKKNPEALNIISQRLEPRTYLEQSFKLEVLIYFRRINELFEIMEGGHEVFISKIAKQSWFFKEFYEKFGAEKMIQDILPRTSYSARMKALNRMCKVFNNEYDAIFDLILERYGEFTAKQFITGCSIVKIEKILEDLPVNLTTAQVRLLYKKDPNLVDKYFTCYNKHSGHNVNFSSYKHFFTEIFIKNCDFYDFLKNKYKFSYHLGRRATRKMVQRYRYDIINSSDKYMKELDHDTLIRKLGRDSKSLVINRIPLYRKGIDDVYKVVELAFMFPHKYRFEVLKELLMYYNKLTLQTVPRLINENMLKDLVKDPKERAALAKVKVDEGEDRFIKYLLTEEAVTLLKTKINVTQTSNMRRSLIRNLVDTCKINNRLDTLLDILKYFIFRHRNDDEFVIDDFLQSLKENYHLPELDAEIWKYIEQVYAMKKARFNRDRSDADQLLAVEFLYNQNKPIDEVLMSFFKNARSSGVPTMASSKPEFRKYVIIFAINNAPNYVVQEEENALQNYDLKIFDSIRNWNKKFPNDPINVFDYPRLVESMKWALQSDWSSRSVQDCLRKKVFNLPGDPDRDEYLKIYHSHNLFGTSEELRWLLKYDPVPLGEYSEGFAQKMIRHREIPIWDWLKKYRHLELDIKIAQYYRDNLNVKDVLDLNVKVEGLSFLLTSEEFAAFADLNKPVTRKLDLDSDEDKENFALRCAIARNFKNTRTYKNLPHLLEYCKGDYFGSALPSLSSFLYHTPERELPEYIEILSKQAISVRKHALFFTCQLYERKITETVMTTFSSQEDNVSLKQRLIDSILRYFMKNPSELLFNLFKTNVVHVDKHNEDMLNKIIHVELMPERFRGHYFEFIWNFVEQLVEKPEKYRPGLIYAICHANDEEIIGQISYEFCLKMFSVYCLKSAPSYMAACINFINHLLMFHPKKMDLLRAYFKIIEQHPTRSDAINFFLDSYYIFMRPTDPALLNMYIKFWEKFVNPIPEFTSYIHLFFLKVKLAFLMEPYAQDTMNKKIDEFITNLVTNYGMLVIEPFADIMDTQLKTHFFTDEFSRYEYLENLLRAYPHNVIIAWLVMLQVPPSIGTRPVAVEEKMKKIKFLLSTVQDLGFKIRFYMNYGSQTF